MSERRRPPKDWEGSVDKAIREAIERGEFENLAGKGRPLDLADNPFTPSDLQLAYKLLKDAGVSLDWIEDGKEISAERARLEALLELESRVQRDRKRKQPSLAPDKIIAEHIELESRRERVILGFRDRATRLNRKIDEYNLKVPSGRLQQRRIQVEELVDRFVEACREK